MAYLIARRARNTDIKGKRKDGVAVVYAGRCLPVTDIELYLAHILACSGMTVYLLFDDGVLEHWDSNQAHSMKYYSQYRAKWFIRWSCALRKRFVSAAYRRKGKFRVLDFSSILKKYDLVETVEESDEEYAKSSTKRFFVTGEIDVQGEHRDYYLKSLRNCVISKTIASYAIDILRPDLYVTSHCIYSVWGPPYAKMKEAGIPILVYHVVGNITGKIRLTDQYAQRLSECTDWRQFDESIPASSKEVLRGEERLRERIEHEVYDIREYYPEGSDNKSLKQLDIKGSGKVFAMFPNVVWDGDLPERNILFDGVIDWCISTIEFFRDSPHQLCIRFHPAEDTRHEGSMKLEQILRNRISDLDSMSNLTLISSGVKLDTYTFARKFVDVGLIYDGTLCLELSYMGIPVVACTNGLFTLDSVAYKPGSRDEYRDYLNNPDLLLERFSIEREERIASACKYAYWLFEESLIDFTPLEIPYPAVMNYNLVKKNEPMSPDQLRIIERLITPLNDRFSRNKPGLRDSAAF